MTTPLELLYRDHHEKGNRLGQSTAESFRGALFRKWVGSGKKLIDLGCRDGYLTRHFCRDNTVVGCDIDTSALAVARQTLSIETRQVDLNSSLPFADAVFDVAIMGEVLEHLPYWDISLAEVRRILRPGGIFIGSIPLAYHLWDRWGVLRGRKLISAGDPTHLQFPTYDEFIGRVSRYFTVAEIVVVAGRRWWSRRFPKLLARVIAFRCIKE